MKKFLTICIILVALAVFFNFLMPASSRIFQSQTIAVNSKGFARNILDDANWRKWWPGGVKQSSLEFHNYQYEIGEKRLSSVIVKIKNETDSFLTELFFIPLRSDSVSLSWEGKILSSTKRFPSYFKSKKINKDLGKILQSMQEYYANEENLYGMVIQKEYVMDSTLISTSLNTTGYPSVENIYSLIDKLKAHAEKKSALPTGLPMLNINTSDSVNFLTRVALPVNKKLNDEGDIVYRWMLGRGNILMTEVKGGPYKINQAFKEMENYIADHRRVAPAIPFQSLVTDRRQVRDTNKWITKVYWPVM